MCGAVDRGRHRYILKTHQRHWSRIQTVTSPGWEQSGRKTFERRNEIIQPHLDAYSIVSTSFSDQSKTRGEMSLNRHIRMLVWDMEEYMKEEPCIPRWIPQTIKPKNGAEWIEMRVVAVCEKILGSPVKLLSHTSKYNKIWINSVLLIPSQAI